MAARAAGAEQFRFDLTMNTKLTAPYQVLDPCLLGRPVHRLPLFAAQLRDDLAQAMRLSVSRRYWGNVQVDSVAFSRLDGSEARTRWMQFAAPAGKIAFSLERKVLLSVLHCRYGGGAPVHADEAAVRVTATEERLAVVLGQQLAGTLAGRIDLNLPAADKALPAGGAFEHGAAPHPAKGSWIITVTLSDAALGPDGSGRFWFALDQGMMAAVLRGLLPERESAAKGRRGAEALAARLQVGLSGRLVSKEVALGTLFDLRVGDVIPISLHRADVLLDESRLFTAAVGERKGKLCLTSFEDVE
jgi:flagellar motor switch protein FliM